MSHISQRLLTCAEQSEMGKNFADTPQACRVAAHQLTWKKLSEDTSWIDGRDIILLAHGMEVQARYCKGEWSFSLETISGEEYDGAVWSCFDDEFQIEIEEIGYDPSNWCHGQATHWRELTERPYADDAANTGF